MSTAVRVVECLLPCSTVCFSFLFFVFIIFMVRKREYAEELNILRNEFLVIGSRSAAGRASSFDGVTFRSEESP